jgi:hypothetical protein
MAVSLVISCAAVHGAPKKTPPATGTAPAVVAPAPAPAPQKKGIFGFKKKAQPVVEVPAPAAPAKTVAASKGKTAAAPRAKAVPAAAPAPAVAKKETAPAKAKANKDLKPKSLPAEQPVVQAADPPKKGWLKGLFSKNKTEEPAQPELARAKTAKPAPVKEVKTATKPVPLVAADEPAPKEKRGILGFFRKLREPIADDANAALTDAGKIERPEDWQERKIVTEDGTAIYSFGPMQASGPDRRLARGATVKVRSVRRGWALVEVEGGFAGYMDSSVLREAMQTDFKEPPPPTMVASSGSTPSNWAPLAPPPDLPDQPSKMDSESALLLLPPLQLEPKPNP